MEPEPHLGIRTRCRCMSQQEEKGRTARPPERTSKYVAAQKRPTSSEAFHFSSAFACKAESFESGRCWVRTSALCRVKAVRYIAGDC
jgi:hypothetical protein